MNDKNTDKRIPKASHLLETEEGYDRYAAYYVLDKAVEILVRWIKRFVILVGLLSLTSIYFYFKGYINQRIDEEIKDTVKKMNDSVTIAKKAEQESIEASKIAKENAQKSKELIEEQIKRQKEFLVKSKEFEDTLSKLCERNKELDIGLKDIVTSVTLHKSQITDADSELKRQISDISDLQKKREELTKDFDRFKIAYTEVIKQIDYDSIARKAASIQLIKDLKTNPDPQKRISAAIALGEGVLFDDSVIKPLNEALLDSDYSVRKAAAETLAVYGPPGYPNISVPNLILMLNDDVMLNRSVALNTLGMVDKKGVSIPQIIPMLKDLNIEIRIDAASALGNMGPRAKSAVLPLINKLDDKNASVRVSAASALGSILNAELQKIICPNDNNTTYTKTAAIALCKVLNDEDWRVRTYALSSLAKIETGYEQNIGDLINLLNNDKYWSVKANAAWALGVLGPRVKIAIDDLINALKSPADDVRFYAAWALGQIGPDAKKAIPELQKLFNEKRQVFDVSGAAKVAVQKISGRN